MTTFTLPENLWKLDLQGFCPKGDDMEKSFWPLDRPKCKPLPFHIPLSLAGSFRSLLEHRACQTWGYNIYIYLVIIPYNQLCGRWVNVFRGIFLIPLQNLTLCFCIKSFSALELTQSNSMTLGLSLSSLCCSSYNHTIVLHALMEFLGKEIWKRRLRLGL